METPPSTLLQLLDIETLDVDLFRGTAPNTDVQRTFGGHVAAQSLVAAVRTVQEERSVHSLHAYFLRPGSPKHNIIYTVDRIRDGRSFSTRRVVATQQGKAIFHLSASFQVHEDGPEHAEAMPDVPSPDELENLPDQLKRYGVDWQPPHPEWASMDMRYVKLPNEAAAERSGRLQAWIRSLDTFPNEPHLHACVLTYMSDVSLLGASITPHGLFPGGPDRIRLASLDHAMWFHRPFRADEWMLYDATSPRLVDSRGLAFGSLFQEGRLCVSVAQEGLLRLARTKTA